MTTMSSAPLPPPRQIRFVNNQGQPPSKRRRINAACLTCRKRKTRCAGEKPICSTCAKNNHTCLGYNDLIERRRENATGRTAPRSGSGALDDVESNSEPEVYFKQDQDDEERDQVIFGQNLDERRRRNPHGSKTSFSTESTVSRRDSSSSVNASTGKPRPQGAEPDQDMSKRLANPVRKASYPRKMSYTEDGRLANSRSLAQPKTESLPYFRYFGPTAIVPGFKQMVVNVSVHRDRRRSRGGSFSGPTPGTTIGHGVPYLQQPSPGDSVMETLDDLPVYDPSDAAPVHPITMSLVKTFFSRFGCNYPFLHEKKCLRMVQEKTLEPILVDSMCALAARFSELPVFTNDGAGKLARSEVGHVFAQRANAATVDTFPCPSVAAVQALLLMAYEGFGANQDSALWMYLGLAIRMAVDLGLQKIVGVKYQGEKDPWYTRAWNRKGSDVEDDEEKQPDDEQTLTHEEQLEVEQERIDTFWAVFVLDRVISSGTGRPVTFRDDDYELALPEPTIDPVSGWPDPFPSFIRIIHLYGRVSDVLNNIHNANDLTQEKMDKLAQMENDLTQIYQRQDPRLNFSIQNFREYVKFGQGTTFILFHIWFHALIIVLHQPTLWFPFGNLNRTQLLSNSHELAVSSAKTIADILDFAELIDPYSFISNPFTSQPMYIAACAWLMESSKDLGPPSPEVSPRFESKVKPSQMAGFIKPAMGSGPRSSKHSLLMSTANQNFQKCYTSLQHLHEYWGGVKYILTALDQKSKGIWDCETYTMEEYESTKIPRRTSLSRFAARMENASSPNILPIAISLTGTTNSPNPSLTVLFQNSQSLPSVPSLPQPPAPGPVSAATPPGNMIYDPIRQSLPETTQAMFPPAYPQPNISAVRHQAYPRKMHRSSTSSSSAASSSIGKSMVKYETPPTPDDIADPVSGGGDSKMQILASLTQANGHHAHNQQHHHRQQQQQQLAFTPPQGSSYDAPCTMSPASTMTDATQQQQQQLGYSGNVAYNQQHHHAATDFAQSGLMSGSYTYMAPTLDSQEIDIGQLSGQFGFLQNDMALPSEWFDYLPGSVLEMLENGAGLAGGGGGNGGGGVATG